MQLDSLESLDNRRCCLAYNSTNIRSHLGIIHVFRFLLLIHDFIVGKEWYTPNVWLCIASSKWYMRENRIKVPILYTCLLSSFSNRIFMVIERVRIFHWEPYFINRRMTTGGHHGCVISVYGIFEFPFDIFQYFQRPSVHKDVQSHLFLDWWLY